MLRTASRALSLLLLLAASSTGCGGTSSVEIGSLDGGALGCPATSPTNGTSCALVAGTRCNYGCADGGPSIATCTGSSWSVAVLEIACTTTEDAGADAAPPPASVPFACGKSLCGVTQYCEQPCCGGVAPPCEAMPEGGACPAGSHSAYCTVPTSGASGTNCQQDPCTPPPPTCVNAPDYWCTPSSSGSRYLGCVCG